jgi:hypothetical protein
VKTGSSYGGKMVGRRKIEKEKPLLASGNQI